MKRLLTFVIVFLCCLCSVSFAARQDDFPLHYNSEGKRVKDAKWLLAGHNRHHWVTFRGDLKDDRFTILAGNATKRMRYFLGDPKPGPAFRATTRSYLLPTKAGGKPVPKSWQKAKAKRRPDKWPLRYRSTGDRVSDAAWLLSGHNKYKIKTYFGPQTRFYTLDLAKASCKMKWRIGYPPKYFQDSGQAQIAECRRFGPTLRGYLTTKPLPSQVWRTRIQLRRPKATPAKRPINERVIATLVETARFSVGYRDSIHYTQGSLRWIGIQSGKLMPPTIVHYFDCSSFATYAYWTGYQKNGVRAPPDVLNGLNWQAGYTGTLATHGVRIFSAGAKAGDLAIYGYAWPYSHTAVVVGRQQDGTVMVVSMGSEPGPYYVPMFYRRDLAMVRRYLTTS